MPSSYRLKEKLELVSTVSVLVLAAAFLLVFVSAELKRPSRSNIQEGLVAGVRIDRPELTAGAFGDQILLIAITTECEPCTAGSASFYREIIKESRASRRTQVTAIFPTGTNDPKGFLSRQDLHLESVKTITFGEVKLSTTPTLILLDRSGRILDFWIGRLSQQDQQHVLKRL